MTATLSKYVFVVLAIGWYAIRYKYARRSDRTPVVRSDRGPREIALLLVSLTGLGLLPFFFIFTGRASFWGVPVSTRAGLAGPGARGCLIDHVSTHASGARSELVGQPRRAGESPAHYRGDLPDDSAPDVLGVLALGPRSSVPVAELGRRPVRHCRIRNPVFWPGFARRTHHAGYFWRSIPRIHGANPPHNTKILLI